MTAAALTGRITCPNAKKSRPEGVRSFIKTISHLDADYHYNFTFCLEGQALSRAPSARSIDSQMVDQEFYVAKRMLRRELILSRICTKLGLLLEAPGSPE